MPATAPDKATVLFVDDEERILRSLKMLFRNEYNVLTAGSGAEALELFTAYNIHVIVSDQRMPGMLGAELLSQVRARSPDTLRLLLTGYSDLKATIDSVNEGEIFRYVHKPWRADEIRATLREAADIALATATVVSQTPPAPVTTAATPGILVIDEDPATHATVTALFGHDHRVHACTDLDTALVLLSSHDIGVVVSETRSRGEDLTGALKALKQHHPDLQTIVLTSFQDTGILIELINQGQVYRFLPKPLCQGLLKIGVRTALERRRTLQAQPRLQLRHRVATPDQPADTSLTRRIAGYLERLRQRTPSGAAPR